MASSQGSADSTGWSGVVSAPVSVAESAAKLPIKQHAVYKDPEADMVIQTTDNVQFRVHSYYLKAARSVSSMVWD
jgi:hypothetical protein